MTGDPETLGEDDRRFVAALRQRSPAIAAAVDLVSRFATMVKDQVARGARRRRRPGAPTPAGRTVALRPLAFYEAVARRLAGAGERP